MENETLSYANICDLDLKVDKNVALLLYNQLANLIDAVLVIVESQPPCILHALPPGMIEIYVSV